MKGNLKVEDETGDFSLEIGFPRGKFDNKVMFQINNKHPNECTGLYEELSAYIDPGAIPEIIEFLQKASNEFLQRQKVLGE